MAGELDGRVAVVTGGGSGIGEAIARALAAAGARVVVAGRRQTVINAVAKSIQGLAVAADVTRTEELAAVYAACATAYGRLDILVNSAGIGGVRQSLETVTPEDWVRTLAVNVQGVAMSIKYAIPLLKRQGGSVINISSRDGLVGARPNRSDYVASKFALNGLTESVAQELGKYGIRVNDICPGAVVTDMLTNSVKVMAQDMGRPLDEVWQTQFRDKAALGRVVDVGEIARTAVFLASDAASGITGAHIKVDCGRA